MQQTIPNITSEAVKRYQESLSPRVGRATVKRKMSSVKRFVDWASNEGHIAANPFEKKSPLQQKPLSQKVKVPALDVKTLAWTTLTVGMAVFTFVFVSKVKLPISFRLAPAKESPIGQGPAASPGPLGGRNNLILDIKKSTSTPSESEKDVLYESDRVAGYSFDNGNVLIGGPDVSSITLSTATASDGDITINPDGSGNLNLLFEGTSGNYINASAANLINGSLYYGYVGNNGSGYNLINLQSGSSPTTRFSVDSAGNTYVGGNLTINSGLNLNSLDLSGDLKIGGVTRFNSSGRLASITGYYQDSGLFEIDQGAPDWASISKVLTSSTGAASKNVLTLTLDESGLTTGSSYDTLVLSRSGAASGGYALDVTSGDVNIAGSLTVGQISGQVLASWAPTIPHTGTWATGSSTWNQSDASIYINPSSAASDSNLIAGAVNGSVKFAVDAEGDVYANNLIVAGSVSQGTTTVAGDLTVEGNTTLGDASTDTFTINPNTITVTNSTNFDLKNATVGALTFESSLLTLDTNSSRVGIGAASPAFTLDVNGAVRVGNTSGTVSAPQLRINGTGGNGIDALIRANSWSNYYSDFGYDYDDHNATIINSVTNGAGGAVKFLANGLNTVTIDASGNVGVGDTTPDAPLDVVGDATVSGTLAVGVMNQVDAGTCNAAAEGQMYYDKGSSAYYQCNGSSWASLGGSEEAGQIAAFNGSCPSGWSEVTAARGRYIVGTPASGTNGATVGTALSDQENRPVGKHDHGITDNGHTHSYTALAGAPDGIQASGGSLTFSGSTTGSSATGITINYTVDNCDGATSTCTVAGTNAPYIQYTYCSKDAGADLAEWITADTVYPAGTIVSANPVAIEQVMASNEAYDPKVIGIVATKPGWIIGEKKENSVLLALAGRVPTYIAADSGEIRVGDPIAVSSSVGAGMKATKSGWIVGTALENWTPESHKDKIIVFVNPSWWDPTFVRDVSDNGELVVNDQKVEFVSNSVAQDNGNNILDGVEKVSYYFYLGSNEVFDKVGVFSDLVAANIVAGGVEVKDLLADTVRANKIVSPVVETNLLSPIPDEDLTVRLANNSKFRVENGNEEEVASVDASGSAKFAGTVAANNLVATNASLSGTLYAAKIESGSLAAIEETLRKAEEDIRMLNQDSEFIGNNQDLRVASDLSLVNSLTIGTDFIFQQNSIDTLKEPLRIQSLALAPVEIMGGAVSIDTSGNVTINGNLFVAGVVEAPKVKANEVVANRLVIADSSLPASAGVGESQITSNATVGSASIASGSAAITINNPNVSDYSLVYITPTTPTANQVLYVKSKQEGSFVVGFEKAVDIPVEFNWWIIGLDKNGESANN